jgi:sucrose-6-phosphate hydrolase SacC (GH32 family)
VDLSEMPVSLDAGECLEIQATLSAKTAGAVGLRVSGKTEIRYDAKGGVLIAGTARKVIGTMQPLRLRVFLDRRVMEVYANDGQAAIFTTVDGSAGDRRVEAFAHGGAGRLEDCRVWPMKAARMSLDRFKV